MTEFGRSERFEGRGLGCLPRHGATRRQDGLGLLDGC